LDRKPRVLILYDYYVPAYKAGGPVQSLANLVELLGEEIDFFILTGAFDLHEKNNLKGIEADQWTRVGKGQVFYSTRRSIAAVDQAIDSINPDVLYLNGMFSFYFMLYPVFKYAAHKKIILAPRGMLAPMALSIKNWKKRPYVFLLRLMGIYKKVVFHATKDVETREIRRHFSAGSRIREIPNVAFTPQDEFPKVPQKNEKDFHIYTVARISPEKNVHFIFEVLRNYQSGERISMHLIGNPENSDYLNQCYDLEKKLPGTVSVEWTGHLDQPDIRPKIRDYHLFIFPSAGENFGHAIFEALGNGKPVLISDRTPWHGLEEAQAGIELPLDNREDWLEKIEFFAGMDAKTYAEWSRGAWEYARNYFGKQDLKKLYLEMFSV